MININLAEHKKKIDSLVIDQGERMRRMELLKNLKEKLDKKWLIFIYINLYI